MQYIDVAINNANQMPDGSFTLADGRFNISMAGAGIRRGLDNETFFPTAIFLDTDASGAVLAKKIPPSTDPNALRFMVS